MAKKRRNPDNEGIVSWVAILLTGAAVYGAYKWAQHDAAVDAQNASIKNIINPTFTDPNDPHRFGSN